MGEPSRVPVSHVIFAAVFLLGAFLRLNQLGAVSLSESEAAVALRALALAGGPGEADPGMHPGYTALTGLIFFLFADTNFTARLVPALAGALLVFAPWVLRGRLGTAPALVMSAGLALDPLLVGVSRLADGPMLAVGSLSLFAALRIARYPGPARSGARILAGALAGLALLAGPAAWLGLLVLVFAWATTRLIASDEEDRRGEGFPAPEAAALAGVLLLAGTLFLRAPGGIDAFARSMAAFVESWLEPASTSITLVLIALGAYHALVVLFAALDAFSGDPGARVLRRRLLAGAGVALAVILIHPGRQVADLAWVAVPLWGPAAAAVARALHTESRPASRPVLLTLALLVLAVSFWVNTAGILNSFPQDPAFSFWTTLFNLSQAPALDSSYALRILVVIGTLVLAGLAILLAGMGWEPGAARTGTRWALVSLMGFGLLNGVFGGAHLAGQERRELWLGSPIPGESALLNEALHELGDWSTGQPESLEVLIGSQSPSVRWALRRFPNANLGEDFEPGDLPAAIVTDTENQNFRIPSAYRGQGLTWQVEVGWDQMSGRDWARWLLFREARAVNQQIIIWARADLFLAGEEIAIEDLLDPADPEAAPEQIVPLEDVEDILPDG